MREMSASAKEEEGHAQEKKKGRKGSTKIGTGKSRDKNKSKKE